jgi:hypothetical protein
MRPALVPRDRISRPSTGRTSCISPENASADSDWIPIARSTVNPEAAASAYYEQSRLPDAGLAPEHERPATTLARPDKSASRRAHSRARPTTME